MDANKVADPQKVEITLSEKELRQTIAALLCMERYFEKDAPRALLTMQLTNEYRKLRNRFDSLLAPFCDFPLLGKGKETKPGE